MTAASLSGSGAGKGLLVKAICAIAYGVKPSAITVGAENAEPDKRIVATLLDADQVVFLDNVNNKSLQSDTLASAMTERPAKVRLLGESRTVNLNSAAFVVVTGNGLTISEDLNRRFLQVSLDPGCEEAHARPFAPGYLESIFESPSELISAALTIWRWGRQNYTECVRGLPIGSYETWAQWVRDPLLTLGCQDPVALMKSTAANDPEREQIKMVFTAWWSYHGVSAVTADNLDQTIKDLIDPQKRGRQFIEAFLRSKCKTRAAGFVLTRQKAVGKWGAATYALQIS